MAEDTNGNANTSVTPVQAIPVDSVAPEDVTDLNVQCLSTSLIFSGPIRRTVTGDLASYHIYFNGATEPVSIDGAQNSYQADALDPATAYLFRITAVDQDGNESAGRLITGITLLDNPTGLAAHAYSGYVDLSWDAVLPADLIKHYAVYLSDADFSSVASMSPVVTAAGTSVKIAGLPTIPPITSPSPRSIPLMVSKKPLPRSWRHRSADAQGPVTQDIRIGGSPLTDGANISESAMISRFPPPTRPG